MLEMDVDAGILKPYLPRLVLHWLLEDPNEQVREVDGSIAFVDISGFTKLSERLAKRGKVGAEELTDAIGTCFARLLAVAYGNGGGLIKFGGDALLVLFTGPDHAAKAARAAVGMRSALRHIGKLDTPGGKVNLRMSVGVHSGRYQFFLVGHSHRELIIAGLAATETVLMEGTAEAGEILVSQALAAQLPASVLGDEKGPGRLLRREPAGFAPEKPETDPQVSDGMLLECIPVAVRDQLCAGIHEPEHRRVVVAFIHFDDTDDLIEHRGLEATADALHVLVRNVQRAVDRQGITFLGTDIDRNGGKIILAAGTPVATGNDEERMLLALREIMDCDYEIPIRIGVNRGPVFAGEVGPPYRRTYTVMGDAVNLAARVMAKAQPGQLLATASVLDPSRTQFETEALEPFHVKGKSMPVQAFAVGAVVRTKKTTDEGVRTPLIGREKEMEVLQSALDSARRGEGRLVEIIGEPGIGKSRLIEELRDRAGDMVSLSIACELYESSTPYFPFQDLLRDLIGIDPAAGNEHCVERLLTVLRENDPQLLPWAPLLALALEIEMEPTPETAALEDRFRRPRLEEVAVALLQRLLPQPTLITIEDTHWMDEASSDLLKRITQVVPQTPWLICATRRNVAEGFVAPEAAHVASMRPEPLAPEAAAALVDAVTGDTPLAPHEIAALSERSGGNPLFLKELLAAARAAGGIEGLPDSVEALITARIDRLPPVERNLLRQLSVLGQTFARDVADSVLSAGFPSDEDRIWDLLGEFLSKDSPGSVSFRHALIRDAAYEGLPFRLRRDMHARIGETIEKSAGDNPEDDAELLSFHFFHSQRFHEAWRYSLVAAERAKAIYANLEAADFYQRALESARRIEDLAAVEIPRITEELGDARNRTGAYVEASDAYKRVRKMVAGDPVAEARLMLKLAWMQGWLRRHSQALRSITRGLRILEGKEGREAAAQRAQLSVWYARFYEEEGRHAQTIKWCQRAIEEAEASGEKEALAHAYRLLDWAYVALGRLDLATCSPKALALYEEIGDLQGQGSVLNNSGAFAYWEGRWNEAMDLYRRSEEIGKKIGDAVDAAFGAANIGEILSDQGRLKEAEERLTEALRVWQASGRRSRVAHAKSDLALAFYRGGRFEEAMRLLTEAKEESSDVGAEVDLLETDSRIAECYVFKGDAETALGLADEALARSKSLGGVAASIPLLHRIRGIALIRLGRLDEATDALHESLQAAETRNADFEAALTLRTLAHLARLRGEAFEDFQARSASILDRLGVVSVPDALTPAPARAKA